MRAKTRRSALFLIPGIATLACYAMFTSAQSGPPAHSAPKTEMVSNAGLSIAVEPTARDFYVAAINSRPVFHALSSVEIEGGRISVDEYPSATTERTSFTDELGSGEQLVTRFTGLAGKPDIERVLRAYRDSPFGSVTLRVVNATGGTVVIHSLRPINIDSTAAPNTNSIPKIDLGGPESRERVLADSFSEDRPTERIYDLGKAPDYRSFDDLSEKSSGIHVAVGSQLIYNRDSGRDLFMGALTSRKWLTIFHLKTGTPDAGPVVTSLTVDSAGTKEPQQHEALSKATPENLMDPSIPVKPGESLESEPVLFSTGTDYHAQLEAYGAAVKKVNHPRTVGRAPAGWWSWTSYYAGVTDGLVRTNARWMAQNLKPLGFDHILIDEGYQYARGEYTTTDAMHFPDGMIGVGHAVCEEGLTFGVWTAPFEVSKRAWVYEHHKDWLVHNAAGEPIPVLQPEIEPLYALDTTNPGAQEYLTKTYHTLTHDWGVRYIKLDFMDDAAIDGVHYVPNTTAIEAQRIGLKIIREAVGEDVQLDKDGSAMLAPVGYVDEGRISTDTGHSWEPSKTAASGIAERYYMNRNFYVSDPDAFTLTDQKGEGGSPGTTMDEAEVSIVLSAVAGGMYEIGDDLPLLGAEPKRLKLVRNHDLLSMYKYGHAAVPLDLMSYEDADEQPSIFLLHEGANQTMLAVFNWTDKPRTHAFTAADLGLPAGHKFFAVDSLRDEPWMVASAKQFSFEPPLVKAELRDQPPHSVRLIKIIDQSVEMPPLDFRINIPETVEAGKAAKLTVTASDPANPIIEYLWAFGDGTSDTGDAFAHAYTRAGDYTITVTGESVAGATTSRTTVIHVTGAVSPDFHFDQNKRQQ
jgi:alpha-galactosidase